MNNLETLQNLKEYLINNNLNDIKSIERRIVYYEYINNNKNIDNDFIIDFIKKENDNLIINIINKLTYEDLHNNHFGNKLLETSIFSKKKETILLLLNKLSLDEINYCPIGFHNIRYHFFESCIDILDEETLLKIIPKLTLQAFIPVYYKDPCITAQEYGLKNIVNAINKRKNELNSI
jgi:hypothetical protein